MTTVKVTQSKGKDKSLCMNDFDHFLALDYSMEVMAIAHMRRRSSTPETFERPSDIKELKQYLATLKGRRVLAIEETTTAQWLYVELVDHVERIILCDPYHNRLLSDGPKTDKVDAGKLCLLLRAGLLKEVFHSLNRVYELRRLVSAYEDLVKAGVRALNQKASLEQGHFDSGTHAPFILEHLQKSIELYRAGKEQYERTFAQISRRNRLVKNLLEVTGIGTIGAVKIVAIVVDAHRFARAGNYLSYCGLVKHEKISGGRSYGRRRSRYNRTLKAVYKLAAMSAISGTNNPVRAYYDVLLARGVAEHNARHAVARYLARLTYGMLKSGKPYRPFQRSDQIAGQQAA
jgi:transposase